MTATMTESAFRTVLRGGWIAEGVERERGEVIDTSSWLRQRSVETLVMSRYLDITDRDVVPVACECARLWDSPESAELHRCSGRKIPTSAAKAEPGPTAAEKVAKPRKPRVRKGSK